MTASANPKESSVIENTRVPLEEVAKKRVGKSSKGKRSKRLVFEVQEQCHSNWCWAAVAASISAFYNKASPFTQCQIANLELDRSDCCDFPCYADNVDFNETHTLGSPLNQVGCLDREDRFERAARGEVQQEINSSRPLCARIVWPDGSAHFVVIIGYFPETDTVLLADPFFKCETETSYERFCTDYQGVGGQWNDTYYTKEARS